MREIKFRFYDFKISRSMIHQDPIEAKNIIFEKWETTPKCSPLMQYTGLKDKNGKEIYEGGYLQICHSCWSGKGQSNSGVTSGYRMEKRFMGLSPLIPRFSCGR